MTRAVPEWIGKTDSTPAPPRVRDRVRERDGNVCRGCSRQLREERAECDHVVAVINGGKNRESNLQTLCLWCHASKTRCDVAEKSKTYRVRSKHRGVRKRSSFQTNRDGPYRKKISGEVVRR